MVGQQQQVAAEQLVRLARQRPREAIGEEADAGQAGDGDHQRQPEQAQLAGAEIALQHLP